MQTDDRLNVGLCWACVLHHNIPSPVRPSFTLTFIFEMLSEAPNDFANAEIPGRPRAERNRLVFSRAMLMERKNLQTK